VLITTCSMLDSDHFGESRLDDRQRALHTWTEGGVDRATKRTDAIARALDDRVQLRMANEVVLHRSHETVRAVLDADGQAVETGTKNLLAR